MDAYANTAALETDFIAGSNNINLQYTFFPSSAASQGWLDWFELQGRRSLTLPTQQQLGFRDWLSVGPNQVAEFIINNSPADTEIWEVTHPQQPVKMNLSITGYQARFKNDANELKEYAF